jgi:hypothetical protein
MNINQNTNIHYNNANGDIIIQMSNLLSEHSVNNECSTNKSWNDTKSESIFYILYNNFSNFIDIISNSSFIISSIILLFYLKTQHYIWTIISILIVTKI